MLNALQNHEQQNRINHQIDRATALLAEARKLLAEMQKENASADKLEAQKLEIAGIEGTIAELRRDSQQPTAEEKAAKTKRREDELNKESLRMRDYGTKRSRVAP
jgi:hypothetical protein